MADERKEGEKFEVKKFTDQIERQRDELRVKLFLAKLEERNQWRQLERKWEHMKANTPQMREELGATASGVGEALNRSVGELREGFARLPKLR